MLKDIDSLDHHGREPIAIHFFDPTGVEVAVRGASGPLGNIMMPCRRRRGPGKYNVIEFVSITDVTRAITSMGTNLALRLLRRELPFTVVFDLNGSMLRLAIAAEIRPATGTVLGWQVPDIRVVAQNLQARGLTRERYQGLEQDTLAIWTLPSRAGIAWFKDPGGIGLSISEHPELKN